MTIGLLALSLGGCSGSDSETEGVGPCGGPCETLSEYGFFEEPLASLVPRDGVLPYEPASALWSDNATKPRFIQVPEGSKVGLDSDDAWTWPVGTTLIKNFAFPADLSAPDGPLRVIETRLLVLDSEGWKGHVYLWNDAQTDAVRFVAGKVVEVSYVDTHGVSGTHNYLVPNTNMCANCHATSEIMHPLGLMTPQMNRLTIDGSQNQLESLGAAGLFSDAVPDPSTLPAFPDPFGDAPVDLRARAYLQANCSHCHRDGGAAGSTGLWFDWHETEWPVLGVCKIPVAAGAGAGTFRYDIVPGDPDHSIVIFRMQTTSPGIKMPEVPNLLPDEQGIALLREWISQIDYPPCE